MAKCYNCGKSFDYEKFYGICPKCSAYNREKLPEEEHQELHEQYDEAGECSNQNPQDPYGYVPPENRQDPYGYVPPENRQDPYGYVPPENRQEPYGYVPLENRQDPYGYVPLDPRPKSSAGAITLFIFLILGIVTAIGMPFVYLVGKSMSLGVTVARDAMDVAGDLYREDMNNREDHEASLDDYADELPLPETERIRQSVEVTTAGIQTPCVFGEGPLTLTVTEAPYVIVPSGQLEEFPAGENLVAIPVSYLDESTVYHTYNSLGIVYVGYGEQTYRAILTPYEVTGYTPELDLAELIDAYSVVGEEGQGIFVVFVPEEITNFSLYLESRDEDTNQMLGLYEIPMEIGTEGSDQAQSGEAE